MICNSATSLSITKKVMEDIINTVGKYPPETGGILGANTNGVVTHFYYDRTGISSASGYAPDVLSVNSVLANCWMPNEIFMVGIVHSHSTLNIAPSCGDIAYGIRILQALDTVEEFYLPIVAHSEANVEMHCYVISPDPDRQFICRKVDYEIVDE